MFLKKNQRVYRHWQSGDESSAKELRQPENTVSGFPGNTFVIMIYPAGNNRFSLIL
jgi:hypothetical protein